MASVKKSQFEDKLLYKIEAGYVYFDRYTTVGTELSLWNDGIRAARVTLAERALNDWMKQCDHLLEKRKKKILEQNTK